MMSLKFVIDAQAMTATCLQLNQLCRLLCGMLLEDDPFRKFPNKE